MRRPSVEVWRMTSILWLLAVVLLVAWALGIGGVYTIGGAVHLFLVLALVAVVINLFAGGPRRVT